VMQTLATFGADEDHRPVWDAAITALGLTTEESAGRLDELEAFLDQIETRLEEWAVATGAL